MNTKSPVTYVSGLAIRSATVLLLANAILLKPATAAPCDAPAIVSSLATWLNQDRLNYVTAVVVSHRPHKLFEPASQVTYSKIVLRQGSALTLGWLFTDTADPGSDPYAPRHQYFNDRLWAEKPTEPPQPGDIIDDQGKYPFSPYWTDSIGLTITPSAGVTVTLKNGSQAFTASCLNGLLIGGPTPTNPGGISAIGVVNPVYTISFELGQHQGRPK